MNETRFAMGPRQLRRAGKSLLQAVALALALTLAIPAWAADARAVKSRVAPIYPEIAKRMKITGVVTVEATVEADGKVSNVKTLSGNSTLAPAAEDAVRKWRFVPGDDKTTVDININFSL